MHDHVVGRLNAALSVYSCTMESAPGIGRIPANIRGTFNAACNLLRNYINGEMFCESSDWPAVVGTGVGQMLAQDLRDRSVTVDGETRLSVVPIETENGELAAYAIAITDGCED